MRRITKYSKQMKITYLKMSALMLLIGFFLLPNFTKVERTGDTIFDVTLNGQFVGSVSDALDAQKLLWKARKQAAAQQEGFFMAKPVLSVQGREAYFVTFSTEQEILDAMKKALLDEKLQQAKPAYTIKINQLMVSVRTIDEVRQVLQAALNQYQDAEDYVVELGPDQSREINVLTAVSVDKEKQKAGEESGDDQAGVTQALTDMLKDVEADKGDSFEAFDYGLKDIQYEDKLEIVEAYLTDEEIASCQQAIELVTQKQEKEIIYEVGAGDTLSEIALKNDIPLDKIIALNENLENDSSLIRIGDELKLTEPEPELSLIWQEELYYEEDYEADIEYIYNDDWYTNESQVVQQPSAGHRKVAARKLYRNEKEMSTEILKEEVSLAAVPKIVEKGTKVPPTYIRPISGGRTSSPFGRRKAPKKGASTYHKGIDWATPVGTAVVASSGGTIARAGWGSGYGYVVYINHADGKQTRYGHLSKVLVKAGDKVSQGQKIALSGNTGRSTGPHLHFELLVNGSAVNPLDYLH